MAGYLTAAYCSLAYLQVIAPSNLQYQDNTITLTIGGSITDSPIYDGESVTSWSISPALPAGFTFNTSTGVISGGTSSIVYSTQYVVTATNAGGSATTNLSVRVNDYPPTNLSYSTPTATYIRNAAITANSPTISGGAVDTWGISPALPQGLSINALTGVITGTPTATTAATNYTVTATNTGGSTTAVISIAVTVASPTNLYYSANSYTFTNGVQITSLSPTVTGTVASYSVSPSLPSGLSFNTSTGVISGTPSGIFSAANYTVTATNAGGSTTKTISITVNDVAPSSLAYSVLSPTYIRNQAITANSPSSSGGAVVSYSVTPALPSGISLNTSTGVITGTPTAITAAQNYTVLATNTGGSTTAVLSIAVTVTGPSSLSYSANSYTFTNGTTITSLSPTVTGTVTGYSVSPSLPTGLDFNSTTGVISGRPTGIFNTSNYTVTASNDGGSATKVISIRVNDVPPTGLSYTRMSPTYLKDEAITVNSPSSSGGAVVTYSISPALPDGLSLNVSTGVISGTPTTPTNAASYTVTASNTGGFTTASLTIGVTGQAPIFAVPESYASGTKATLTINRPGLASISVIQSDPVFSEQSNWHRVKAVWVNSDVEFGNTNRVTGTTFRGTSDMTAKFKATAESGTYELRNIYIVRENGQKFRVKRSDLSNPEALDIPIA